MDKPTAPGRNPLAGDLALAARLVSMGTPLFRARIYGPKDSPRRYGWENVRPDMGELARWKPGMALCAVMGIVFDVIDWDPRNDPDGSGLEGLRELFHRYKPTVYLKIRTPSGAMPGSLAPGRSGANPGLRLA